MLHYVSRHNNMALTGNTSHYEHCVQVMLGAIPLVVNDDTMKTLIKQKQEQSGNSSNL